MDAQPEIRGQLQGLITLLLKDSVFEGDYQEAFPIFSDSQGAFEAYHRGFKPTCGSVEYNAVECLSSNIPSLVSFCAGSLLLTSETGAEDRSLALGLALVHKSLAFSGITDMQRVAGPGVPRKVVERTRTLHPEMCAKPGQVPAARQD